MPFSFASAGTKQMGKKENKSFGTKTKQMSFSFASAKTKQMEIFRNKSFGTKTKQMPFSFKSARTKQMRPNHLVLNQSRCHLVWVSQNKTNGDNSFGTKSRQMWLLDYLYLTILNSSVKGLVITGPIWDRGPRLGLGEGVQVTGSASFCPGTGLKVGVVGGWWWWWVCKDNLVKCFGPGLYFWFLFQNQAFQHHLASYGFSYDYLTNLTTWFLREKSVITMVSTCRLNQKWLLMNKVSEWHNPFLTCFIVAKSKGSDLYQNLNWICYRL